MRPDNKVFGPLEEPLNSIFWGKEDFYAIETSVKTMFSTSTKIIFSNRNKSNLQLFIVFFRNPKEKKKTMLLEKWLTSNFEEKSPSIPNLNVAVLTIVNNCFISVILVLFFVHSKEKKNQTNKKLRVRKI